MLNIDRKIKKIIKFNAHSKRKIAPQRYFVAGSQKLPVQYTNPLTNFKLKKFGGKKDWDGDGIKNKWDCQPFNVMRQDIVTLFHGTKKENVPQIKKHGLKPTKNMFGPPAVFLTANKKRAAYHANKGCMFSKCEGTVLNVKVDDKHLEGESLSNLKKHPFKEVRIYDKILPKNISSETKREQIGCSGASIQKQKQWNTFSLTKKNVMRKQYIDTDGDSVPNRWDCQPRNKWKQDFALTSGVPLVDHPKSYGYTGKRVFMTPDTFMDTAKRGYDKPEDRAMSREKHEERVIFKEHMKELKQKISDPETEVDAPYLEYTKSGGIDHEGRHRAVAARELGYKKIPVNLVFPKGCTDTSKYGWEDNDSDGIINAEDCNPNNPDEQGAMHEKDYDSWGNKIISVVKNIFKPDERKGVCFLCGQPREYGDIGHVCRFRSVSKEDREKIFGEGVPKEEQDEYLRKYATEETEEEEAEDDEDYNTTY